MGWKSKYLQRNSHRFEPMKPYLIQHDSIIDLAIGAGGYYKDINVKKIVGVDLRSDKLKRAKEFNPIVEIIQEDVLETGLPDNEFSLVVLSHIIEHFKDYHPLINEAKRLCKNDGCFLIGLPIECYVKEHYHPVWTEDNVRDLAIKFGDILDLQKIKDSWLIYVKKT